MEIILILAVVMLFFGAAKLPELARGSGRALRIFKSEIRGLEEDEKQAETATSDADEPVARRVESTRVDAPDDPR
ncbi:MAG: twin-arginine translocase TatA/TatE family subunit [Aeromicrobium sp.]|uniref:twin-arginine translocase TatA/TatE family subunit n=1 Tax=Aeromicrobium sp. TaxID=1871063 RepID=UPI0039E5C0C7